MMRSLIQLDDGCGGTEMPAELLHAASPLPRLHASAAKSRLSMANDTICIIASNWKRVGCSKQESSSLLILPSVDRRSSG